MKVSNVIKDLIIYWVKGTIIILGVMMVMTLINVALNEEFINQFWQGFIVASTAFMYSRHHQQKVESERVLRIIEEIEDVIQKHEDQEKEDEDPV